MPDYRIMIESPSERKGMRKKPVARIVRNVPSSSDAERQIRLLPGEIIVDICQAGHESTKSRKEQDHDDVRDAQCACAE